MRTEIGLSAWRAGAAAAVAVLAALVGGYAYGVSRPVATAFGDLPREVVEGLRSNDLAASWRGYLWGAPPEPT
jgi:hypothetical protein